jgi:type I restriction enzyme M protein
MPPEAVEERALIGIPQIAEIAGVGRSAVGNWRKRHADFPTPRVQTPSGALFDLREVEDWLIEQGKISQRAPASARLWAMADAARGLWMPDEFARFSVAFLVYVEASARARTGANEVRLPDFPAGTAWSELRTTSPRSFLRAFNDAARRIEAANPELDGILDAGLTDHGAEPSELAYQVALTLDAAAPDQSTRCALFEALTDLDSADRFSGEYSTPADVVRLMSRLVDFHGGTILDPAVGEGRLLWQAAYGDPEQQGSFPPRQVVGIDINQEACRRSRARFYLYGCEAEIRQQNALTTEPDSLPLADLIVLDPPYSQDNWGDAELYVDDRWRWGPPPPSSANFAWLQLAAFQLKPTGRASVLMATGSLWRGGREGAIRQRMVESGVVEAIILLPPRLRTNTSIPLALWLLSSPAGAAGAHQILLVDGSHLATTGRSRYSLSASAIDRIVGVVRRWRESATVLPEDEDIAVAPSHVDVLQAGADLTPARYRSQPQIDVGAVEQYAQALRESLVHSSAAATEACQELLSYLESRR